MIPKEKAKELFNKYFELVEANSVRQQEENAKQCALIAVDLLLSEMYADDYYTEVKQEIINL
jgi:hypothetical protein